MASTFDSRFYQKIRDTPLSALGGPPPTRATPVHRGLSRDNWDRTNIWQTTTTALEDLSNEERQNAFPARDSKMIMSDVSKTVAGASGNDGHNNTSGLNKGLQLASASTALSYRSMGPLSSPTRSRNNGMLGIDTTATIMASLGQSSLLPGSAPDAGPPIASPSSSAFKGQRGSTVGRSFQHFNVEDAEEFVPSHLRGSERHSSRPSHLGGNGMFDYHESMNGPATHGSNNSHNISAARIWDQSSSDHLLSRNIGINRAALVPSMSSNRGIRSLSPGSIGAVPGSFNAALAQNGSTGARTTNGFGFGFEYRTESNCKPSNLRPEVASYEPTSSSRFQMQAAKFDNSKYVPHILNASRTDGINDYLISANQYAAWTNSNTLGADSQHGLTTIYGNYSNSELQQISASNVPSLIAGDPRNRGFAYRNSGNSSLHDPRPKHPIETNNLSYGPQSIANSYHSSQNGSAHEASRLSAYQQPYSNRAGNNAPDYFEPIQQSEYDAAGTDVSEVLAEFRAYHRSRKYELKDIYGHIVEFSGDQNGSRFIQTKIEQANSDEKEQIFSELQTNARQLMADVFGNYVIQKMFDYGNQSQKKALASHMQGYMFALSTQAYGCRCIQKAFEHILTDQQAVLIKELEGRAMEVVESQHGNHVIQKAIECIPGEHIQFIVDAHKNQVLRLAKHIYGCRIIQRMLEYCSPQVKRSVLDELHPWIHDLIEDQYGNYVVQCIIKKCGTRDRSPVIECVKQRILHFSKHKFASNVVEKAIAHADDNQLIDIVQRLTGPSEEHALPSPIPLLLADQYGNYVMQTVLKTMQGPRRRALAEEIRHHLNFISKTGRNTKQTTAMADLVNAIIVQNSPSSSTTGPQTPRTPTSLNSAGTIETPLTKAIEMVPPGFAIRDGQRDMLAFKTIHG